MASALAHQTASLRLQMPDEVHPPHAVTLSGSRITSESSTPSSPSEPSGKGRDHFEPSTPIRRRWSAARGRLGLIRLRHLLPRSAGEKGFDNNVSRLGGESRDSPALLDLLRQDRQQFHQVRNHTDGGCLEDRRLRVLVDRQQKGIALDAAEMLERSTDA
jgi:hypothetical protein